MKRILLFILIVYLFTSCESFLEVGPNTNELNTELVFENDNTAEAALNAIYFELQNSGFASGNASSITILGNILADDAIENNKEVGRYEFYLNALRSDNDTNLNIWNTAYKQIYNVNALLLGIENNSNLTEEIKNRIEGEAKFVRAFIYYYLMNLYGEVPLILTTDYNFNKSSERSEISKIKNQIIRDLLDAKDLLKDNYQYVDGEHILPTKYATYVLAARMALLDKDYNSAIDYANEVIDSGKYQITALDEVFKANSKEAIWQLLPTNPTIGASEGRVYILENNPATPKAASSQNLTDNFLSIWEPGDLRYSHWINVYTEGENNYYYPFKYKIKDGGDTEEYSMVMRLAEVYLIRAEAYAMQGKTDKALADLNVLRNRAGLPNWKVTDIHDIQQTVLEERRRELFSEWGHRWLDLKRFGKLDEILREKKSNWSPHAKLLPIPEQDLLRNPFLTQNPGY